MAMNEGDALTLKLTPKQRRLMLENTSLPPELTERLRFGLVEDGLVTLKLSLEDLDEMAEVIAFEIEDMPDRRVARRLEEVLDAIDDILEPFDTEPPPQMDPDRLPQAMPQAMREELAALLNQADIKDLDELNERLQEINARYNRMPRTEFQGLSPIQLANLLYQDWTLPDSPLRINEDLSFGEVSATRAYNNACLLLRTLLEWDGVKATATGKNLPRKFVREVLPNMDWAYVDVSECLKVSKVINEDTLWPFHIERILLQLAGLLYRRSGWFRVTKKGAKLLSEKRAGELYALLFKTYYRKLNSSYVHYLEVPTFQQTVAFSFYALSVCASIWRPGNELSPEVILPITRSQIPRNEYFDETAFTVRRRLLIPMEDFGLLESRVLDEEDALRTASRMEVRKTPLFDRFMSFDFEAMSVDRMPQIKFQGTPSD